MFGKNYSVSDDTVALENVLGSIVVDDPSAKGGIYERKKYQDEDTPFIPQSPYAIAKLAAHHLVRNYREGYGIHGSCGILFNHESERRGEHFVTRKITKWIGEFVASGMDDSFPALRLGNLDARRDWGHAADYVEAMWLMLQQEEPDDYVVATGETYSVRQFLDAAFSHVGIDDWDKHVVIDPEFYRAAEVDYLLGIPKKAEQKLGWNRKVSFKELATRMVDYDVKKARLQRSCLQEIQE